VLRLLARGLSNAELAAKLTLSEATVDVGLEALQAAAGRDGGWLDGWVTLETAAGVERTTDRIASVFCRYQRSDQELPWED
jgi:hypothetical protein